MIRSSSRTARVLLVATLGTVSAYSGAAATADGARPVHSLERSADGWLTLAVDLPGDVLDVAPLPPALGGGLGVLTIPAAEGADDDPDERPRALWRVAAPAATAPPTSQPTIERLADDLPAGAGALLGVAGELWLVGDGTLHALRRTDGRLGVERLLVDRALRPETFAREGTDGLVTDRRLALPGVGTLKLFDVASAPDGRLRLEPAGARPIPVNARQSRHGLALASPLVRPLPADRGEVWATGPEAIGAERLRVTLVSSADAPDTAWLRLPTAETVQSSWILDADGAPLLALATTESDAIDLLEKLWLRVYRLRADRTRSGVGPLLRAETATRRWYIPEVALGDLDGDGADDLVVVQPKGLEAPELRVEVYPGRAGGGFGGKARRVDLDLERAAWSWGDDLDGDGVADLVAYAEGTLSIHRGRAEGRPLERRAWRRVELPLTAGDGDERDVEQEVDLDGREPPPVRYAGRPRPLQLDGDEALELVVVAPGDGAGDLVLLDRP